MGLTRILEPEVMDSEAEALAYDSMDHAEVNRRFVADLLAAGLDTGDLLDLGAGTAQIPIELCRSLEDCRVMAVDLSIPMLEIARYNIEMAGLVGRIMLDHVDGKALPYDDHQFSAVISNSIVHHIPEPLDVLKEAVRVVKPGGLLFFRDLARPGNSRELESLVTTYAGNETEAQQKMFRDSLHAALTLSEIQQLIDGLGLDPGTVQATSDRHWTWVCTTPYEDS